MSEAKKIDIVYSGVPETFFSDIVRIEANPETVSLTFGIKSNDGLSAIMTHRAIMTLPHFFRLAEVCNKSAKDMMVKIENAKKGGEMTLVIDTERVSTWEIKKHYSSSGVQGWNFFDLKAHLKKNIVFNDVFVVYNFATIETDFTPNDLTYMASHISEASFAEVWDKEDDSYWESYL